MNKFVKGYADDAAVDIVLDDILEINPGYQTIVLPCKYTPDPNEVAFLLARSSTAKKGIFPIPVAIDTGYEGIIHAFVVNTTDRKQVFMPGERAFSIVNLVKGKDRVQFEVAKQGKRGSNWNNSSGGNENGTK